MCVCVSRKEEGEAKKTKKKGKGVIFSNQIVRIGKKERERDCMIHFQATTNVCECATHQKKKRKRKRKSKRGRNSESGETRRWGLVKKKREQAVILPPLKIKKKRKEKERKGKYIIVLELFSLSKYPQ